MVNTLHALSGGFVSKEEVVRNLIAGLGTLGIEEDGISVLVPPQLNRNDGVQAVDNVTKRISHYSSGRVNLEGRYPSWALFGRDVPYIFNEIIFGLDTDGRDTQNKIRLSVDKIWADGAPESGDRYFNEIRIYRRNFSLEGAAFEIQATYSLGGGAQQLRSFIQSVPEEQWPTTPTVPSVITKP